MKLLIVDTETTGLKKEEGCKAIEVGAILYSVPFRAPLQSVSFLIPSDENPAQHINGIDPLLTGVDQPWKTAQVGFETMAKSADFAVAHNASFDSQWFGHGELESLDLRWLCTMQDFKWGEKHTGRSLRDLALSHGIAVTPDVHRALPDCQLLSAILSSRDDLEELIEEASQPRTNYRMVVSYTERDQAKSRKFRWDPDRRWWTKPLTEEEAQELVSQGFKLVPVR